MTKNHIDIDIFDHGIYIWTWDKNNDFIKRHFVLEEDIEKYKLTINDYRTKEK